jgi:hypothetical protein
LKVPTLASAAAFALLAGLGVRPALAEATRPCAAAFLVEAPVAHWEGPCYGVGVSTTRRGDLQAASGVLRYTGTKLENLINVFGERKSATSKRISYVAIDSTGAHDFTSADAPPQYRWAVQRIEAVFANRWTPNTFVRPPGVQTAETGRSKP